MRRNTNAYREQLLNEIADLVAYRLENPQNLRYGCLHEVRDAALIQELSLPGVKKTLQQIGSKIKGGVDAATAAVAKAAKKLKIPALIAAGILAVSLGDLKASDSPISGDKATISKTISPKFTGDYKTDKATYELTESDFFHYLESSGAMKGKNPYFNIKNWTGVGNVDLTFTPQGKQEFSDKDQEAIKMATTFALLKYKGTHRNSDMELYKTDSGSSAMRKAPVSKQAMPSQNKGRATIKWS